MTDMTAATLASPQVQETQANQKKKRSRPDTTSEEERQRLRDKNRTNSKRFRDRKKNFMDSLFEEKYRLGKTNNELREENERLRMLFEEALAENEMHRRNAALGMYQREPVLPVISPGLLGVEAQRQIALQSLHPQSRVLGTDLLGVRTMSPGLLGLLGEVEAQKKKQRLLGDLAMRDLEESIKTNLSNAKNGNMPGNIKF